MRRRPRPPCPDRIDDRVELGLRDAEVAHAAGVVVLHALDAHAAVVDEVARELHAPPLVARGRGQVVHEGALLGEEAEHVAVAAEVHELLHELQYVVFGLAHAHDDVRAELLRSEDLARVGKDFPVLPPRVR